MQYINNLWRVDPSSFAATMNMICMRAPALMQRLMDHEVDAANAAIGQYGNMRSSDAAPSGSHTDARTALVPGQQQLPPPQQASALQHPHELEVSCYHNGVLLLCGLYCESILSWTMKKTVSYFHYYAEIDEGKYISNTVCS